MKYLKLILLLFVTINLAAQKPAKIFNQANENYKTENYHIALNLYDSIVNMGYQSPALYYNLANCYFKTGQLARAILYYERAAILAPGDEDIQHNLEVAREKTIDKFEKLPSPLFRAAFLTVMKWQKPYAWGWFSIFCFGLLVIGLGVYLYSSFKRPGFIIAVSGLIIGTVTLSLSFAHNSYIKNNREAIIMAMSSYVKSAPSQNAADAFILHEGTKATILDELEDWKKIRLSDGKIGWIKASDLEKI